MSTLFTINHRGKSTFSVSNAAWKPRRMQHRRQRRKGWSGVSWALCEVWRSADLPTVWSCGPATALRITSSSLNGFCSLCVRHVYIAFSRAPSSAVTLEITWESALGGGPGAGTTSGMRDSPTARNSAQSPVLPAH